MNYPNLEKLIDIISKLRDPKNGCPWDIKQTHHTLLKYLIEESYEFLAAVEEDNFKMMEDEIGDVLLQVVLHCQIAKENQNFDIESVAKNLTDKLIRRHPHVFEKQNLTITDEALAAQWANIKSKEKNRDEKKSLINKEHLKFPSLFSAWKIGKATNKINFDWKNYHDVLSVVSEEFEELKIELSNNNKDQIYEEYGDLLFSIAQLGRHLNLDPEMALRDANRKFIRRFTHMSKMISDEGLNITSMNQEEMDIFWNKVKDEEKRKN